ncbi:uncharacterized protein LOC123988170 [Osmia bicornis bicornis]|uniref:uncharacterized protein LOC123988170 n=1 Tax=Osmia bicornis bicornis TaxID=1437191 RepID=UPI001EAEA464|nr:uncharacterized protein LOC123988170 [Osmia bicornis bicornis]
MLESLGFLINERKSCRTPALRCKFLGMIIDSVQYTLELPLNKKESLIDLLKRRLTEKRCTIKECAELIGKLIAACPAVEYGFLYTKRIEREKILALAKHSGDYNKGMSLSVSARRDLRWWLNSLPDARNSFKSAEYTAVIYSDASGTGWGATDGLVEAHGHWNSFQKVFHINYRELLAVKLALKTLASSLYNCQILLRVDNTTAIAYINRMGGVRYSLYNKLAKEIWQWAEKRRIFLSASYIPSIENTQADRLSRLNDDIEWELNPEIFGIIKEQLGCPEVDLFVNGENRKCEKFISWRPDPEAIQIDAFTVSWSKLKFYAFPPFSLILKTLVKVKRDKATGIMVVPRWLEQPWYPLFRELLLKEPLIFEPDNNLLMSPCRTKIHPQVDHLYLMAGLISGKRF